MTRRRTCEFVLIGAFVQSFLSLAAYAENASKSLCHALQHTRASAVVMALQSNAIEASAGNLVFATPGSLLKPLLLEYALEHGITTEHVQILCHRKLRIGTRTLPCTHPADQDVFTAENALAESCNTYFADLGRRFSDPSLDAALKQSGIPHRSLVAASADTRALTVLGLQNVSTSLLEIAAAYRRLALSLPKDGAVMRGLAGSVRYGMANPVFIPGSTILGKTGTASNPGEAWTHGWFAGILPGKFVIVVYVPHGDGGTAARLARNFLVSYAAGQHD